MHDKTLLLGRIGVKIDSLENEIIEEAFSQVGVKVINVGNLTSQEEFINVALAIDADAILISTVANEGKVNCQKFKQECLGVGLEDVLLYIDGTLIIDS